MQIVNKAKASKRKIPKRLEALSAGQQTPEPQIEQTESRVVKAPEIPGDIGRRPGRKAAKDMRGASLDELSPPED